MELTDKTYSAAVAGVLKTVYIKTIIVESDVTCDPSHLPFDPSTMLIEHARRHFPSGNLGLHRELACPHTW